METQDRKYICTIFKRLRVSEETSIYVHHKTVIGHFDFDRNLFVDSKGKAYDSIENLSNHYSKSNYAYYDTEELRDVKVKIYNNTSTIEELSKEVEQFFDDEDFDEKKAQLADAKVRDSEAIVYFDTDRLSDCFVTHLKEDGTLLTNYFFEEDLLHLDELTYGFNVPSVDELKRKIENNEYSRKELEDIAKRIRNIRHDDIRSLELIKDKVTEMVSQERYNFNSGKPIDIDSIYNKVIKTLIGQNRKVRQTIATISHLDRINLTAAKKEGFLLTGSTGTGKTLMLELISKYVDRPFLLVNSTSLTVPGYTGTDIEEVLWGLIESCGGDVKKAERAIVYFDEIDKKGSDKNSDVSGRGVLNILLKFMDGTEYTACKNMQHIDPKTSAKISTRNMIVGAGGAFANVYEDSKKKNPIGFSPNSDDKPRFVSNGRHADDFVKLAGMPSEFMGRFDDEIHLDTPQPDLLARILLESDQSQLLIEQKIFERDFNVELLPSLEYVYAVAKQAYDRKLGVRGMKSLVKKSIINAYDFCLSNPGLVKTIHLTTDAAFDQQGYKAYDKDGIELDHSCEMLDATGPVLVKMLDNGIA